MQDQPSNEASFFAPVCQVCKSQDESLRVVSYPFVFSVVVMTFQRMFAGVYCAKHQRRYHFLASLITAIGGWLGFPYGFFLTPLTLIKLARGGIVHVSESFSLLRQVADKKLRTGDTKGAIRCLEECLKLQDDPTVREQLTRLYQQQSLVTDRNVGHSVWQTVAVPTLLILAMVVGLLLGLFDTLVIWLMYPLFQTDTSIIAAILSWLPTVLFLFSGILIVRALLKWSLAKIANTSIFLGSFLSFTATGFLFYSILEGQSILRNIQAMFTFYSISMRDGIFAARSILAHGGMDVFINDLSQGNTPGVIFVVLLSAAICLSLYVGIDLMNQIAQWQNRMLQVHQSRSTEFGNSSMLPWTVYGLLLAVFGFAVLFLYPGSYVNIENVFEKFSLGTAQMDQNHPQEATDYFRQASSVWPNSVTGHTYLALGYSTLDMFDEAMEELDASIKLDPNSTITHFVRGGVIGAQGRFIESIEEFETVAKAQPEWGVPHTFLAVLHYNLDEPDLAQTEIEQAIKYQNEDGATISMIGSYFANARDFKKAEEYFLKAVKTDNDPDDYVSLARVYIHLNDLEKAEKIISEADRLGAEPASIYLAKSDLAVSKNDLNVAEKLLQAALKEFPNDSELWAQISYIHFQQGKVDSALFDAVKAVELNPYNSTAYVEMAFVYQKQGRKSEALATAQRGISLDPKYDRAHYILGLSYMDNNMNTEAVQELETFLDLYWERPLAHQYKDNAEALLDRLK